MLLYSLVYVDYLTFTVMVRIFIIVINPLAAKLFNLNFHPFEIVSR